MEGQALRGIWVSADGKRQHPVALQENYDGAVRFDPFGLTATRRLFPKEQGGPSAEQSLFWLIPSAAPDPKQLESVRRFILNCLLGPETAGDTDIDRCETKPLTDDPATLARRSMEDFFRDYLATNTELFSEICGKRSPEECGENGMLASLSWQQGGSMRVLHNDDELLVLGLDSYSYSGGAHGNYGTTVRSFDLRAGRMLRARDIFPTDQLAKVSSLLERRLRQDRGIEAARSSRSSSTPFRSPIILVSMPPGSPLSTFLTRSPLTRTDRSRSLYPGDRLHAI